MTAHDEHASLIFYQVPCKTVRACRGNDSDNVCPIQIMYVHCSDSDNVCALLRFRQCMCTAPIQTMYVHCSNSDKSFVLLLHQVQNLENSSSGSRGGCLGFNPPPSLNISQGKNSPNQSFILQLIETYLVQYFVRSVPCRYGDLNQLWN